jgi:phosphoribosylglycinamide formyltransferase-1
MINLVVFASGSGSNAENIVNYFRTHKEIRVKAIYCNNPHAFVIERAKRLKVPLRVFDSKDLASVTINKFLYEDGIDYIILAGFLKLIPKSLIHAFPNKIINLHPALLPLYGGKGMYGSKVHEAVIANHENKSGITIHLVNEHYDDGKILFRAETYLEPNETPESLAEKVHALEHKYFPLVIEQFIKGG